MANDDPIVGRDAQVFGVQGYGSSASPNSGASYNFLGVWSTVSLKVKKNWVDRTPSSATTDIKRKTTETASLSVKNFVFSEGSTVLPIIAANDMIYVTFTEASTGHTWFFYGGVTEGGGDWSKDGVDNSLDAETVSYAPDGVSLPWGLVS